MAFSQVEIEDIAILASVTIAGRMVQEALLGVEVCQLPAPAPVAAAA